MALSTAPARYPDKIIVMHGKDINLVDLQPSHAKSLFRLCSGTNNSYLWAYMPVGPYDHAGAELDFNSDIQRKASSSDPIFYAIVSSREPDNVLGHAALMRIDTTNRVIEVGHILYSPPLQQTRAATEVQYLLAKYVFEELGYRRYEWKCDSLNEPSRKAALRLGFGFEGIFRQHMIVKGRNRDTAWFAMLDKEWPVVKTSLETWLDEGNFDESGKQKRSLKELREGFANHGGK
ncbi:MAG: hypothetical protein Q9165_004919 [Trypethelium subeluteriae]